MLYSQEEVLHYFMVVASVAVWQETGCKHDDGVHSIAIVALRKERERYPPVVGLLWKQPSLWRYFLWFFLFASQAPFLSLSPFLLDTFGKSVISFCSHANSSPHSVSVNQKALFMEIAELDCFTEGFWLFPSAEESSGTEAFRSPLSAV